MPSSQAVLDLIKDAKPPRPRSHKYFESLIMPTRTLLDKGFSAAQAADLLINKQVLKKMDRTAFLNAIRCRMWRLKSRRPTPGLHYSWYIAVAYNSSHLRAPGEKQSLCGSTATFWQPANEAPVRCARCLGIQKNGAAT